VRRYLFAGIPLLALVACGGTNDEGLFAGEGQDAGASGGAPTAGAGGGGTSGSGGSSGAVSGGTGGVGGGISSGGTSPASCEAVSLSGSWTGTYVLGGLPSTTTGTLELTIDASGAVTGAWVGVSPTTSSADIEGAIDCTTGAITARISNGSYSGLFPPVSGTFEGELSGVLDPGATSVVDGAWTVTEPNGTDGGSGTWTTG
jgi:hypothetical protein